MLDGLTARIDAELERWHVPALELAVVRGDEVLATSGFGRRDVARQLPATPQTLFHHGSTGKAITSVVAATLVDEGLLSWDRPIRDYLPEFAVTDPMRSERITLLDLLSHRSGLARHDLAWIFNSTWDRAEIVRRLRYLDVATDLRAGFGYCNFGYVTAGHVIGVVTGSTYEEQLQKRLLEPLGMTRTVVSAATAQADADHARPYAVRDDRAVVLDYRSDEPIAPAGGLMSCAVDSARWLLFQVAGGRIGSERLLSETTFAQTRSVHIPLPPGVNPEPELTFWGYALGWVVGDYRGEPMVWHSGGIDGFTTQVLVLPKREIGILVSCNAHMNDLPQAVLLAAADTVLGIDAESWFDRKFEAAATMRTSAAEAKQRTRVVQHTAPSHPIVDYAGSYEHPGYGVITVATNGDNELTLRIGDTPVAAQHRHYDTWEFHYPALDVSLPVTFNANPEGYVAELVAPMEPAVAPIRFQRQPDPALGDPALLARLTGRYRLANHVLNVEVGEGGHLVVDLPGSGPVVLEPGFGFSFSAAGLPLEFTVTDDQVLDVVTPLGVFAREDKQ